jgi:ornithine cyclodeaminase/alanine dehydrogenase-like protein (mu-crystallin family)
VFRKEDVVAELSEMCSGRATLRTDDKEVTVFKAIGQALADLVAASKAFSASR